MRSYIAAFLIALVAGLFLTPAVRWLALHRGVVGRNGSRHVHSGKIPRLGGLALVFGWAAPLALFLPLEGFGTEVLANARLELVGAIGGAFVMCFLGAADDIRGLRVVHKLIGQCAVAAFAYACGFRIDAISLPLIGTLPMGIFAGPITVLWIVGITNAVNLIDGLDGLAAGVSFFAALTGFVVAIINGSALATLVLAPLMGVLLAFLVFNFNPARIFMGDSGSYFLGYVLATTSLAGAVQQKASTAVSLLVPMIALGLPIFDTLFSMLRRYLERRPIFAPDRGHVHHRLLELGLTHRRAVMLLYGVSVTFAACAITISLGRSWETGVALLAASAVLVVLVRFTGYFGSLLRAGRPGLRSYDATTERLRADLPFMLRSLNEARTEHQILDILKTAGDACGCEVVEVRTDYTSRRLDQRPTEPASGGRTSYPLGVETRARARLDLVWETIDLKFSPQAGILFQLLIDAAAQALERCSSALGPQSEPPPASPAHSPALVAVSSSD
ncbi:MAG TPA: MraY family glycosyltransferase [Polyangiaceae bacterium]|nr:MraY family glycosyltransferase [Polyangiaceae bacterium]